MTTLPATLLLSEAAPSLQKRAAYAIAADAARTDAELEHRRTGLTYITLALVRAIRWMAHHTGRPVRQVEALDVADRPYDMLFGFVPGPRPPLEPFPPNFMLALHALRPDIFTPHVAADGAVWNTPAYSELVRLAARTGDVDALRQMAGGAWGAIERAGTDLQREDIDAALEQACAYDQVGVLQHLWATYGLTTERLRVDDNLFLRTVCLHGSANALYFLVETGGLERVDLLALNETPLLWALLSERETLPAYLFGLHPYTLLHSQHPQVVAWATDFAARLRAHIVLPPLLLGAWHRGRGVRLARAAAGGGDPRDVTVELGVMHIAASTAVRVSAAAAPMLFDSPTA